MDRGGDAMTPLTLERYEQLTAHVEYANKGMFFSEGFLFLEACSRAGVDLIIESGIHRGVSTRLLNAVLPGQVLSVEIKAPIDPPTDARILIGDGMTLVPELIQRHPAARIGVLIDGPKRHRARELRDLCLGFAHVRVVALHDQPQGLGEQLHSHAGAFRKRAGARLDARVPEPYRSKFPLAPGLSVWERA
jgi:hypothetical protein